MRILSYQLLKALLAPVIALGLAAGCQTYNPATGQQQIDYGATAGVAGAAMGAAALGVALSNNNNNRFYGGRPIYYGGRGRNNINVNRNFNVNGNNFNRNNRIHRVNRVNRVNGNFGRRNHVGARGNFGGRGVRGGRGGRRFR